MASLTSLDAQLLGKDVASLLDDLTSDFNKIESSSSVFFTYITSYINALCDTILSRVELFNATKDLYSIAGPAGNSWSLALVKSFAVGESELLSSDARIIIALRADVERTQVQFQTIVELLRDKFSKRHAKQKECARILEQRESKRPADPTKEKKRAKKFETKLKPIKSELVTASDALIAALSDFKLSYLDWMEPLIHVAAQMRLRHPEHTVDAFLNDSTLEELRTDVNRSADKLRASFALLNSAKVDWSRLTSSLDSFVQYPLAVVYFKQFSEREHVSESFYFYQEAKKYKALWAHDGDTTPGAAVAQARHIASLCLEDGSKQEINIPQALKMSVLKQIREGASESLFDKPLEAISEMLEDTFHHFLDSPLAEQLQDRLERIRAHHSNLTTTGTIIPQLGAAKEDASVGDTTSSTEARRNRPRSGSANQPAQRNTIYKRSSSSSLIVVDPSKIDQESPPKTGVLVAPAASVVSAGKSNTAPLPHLPRRQMAQTESPNSTPTESAEHSPRTSPIPTPLGQDATAIRTNGGMKTILNTLTGILGPKPTKTSKKRPASPSSTPPAASPTEFTAAAQQATELGPLATRHFCLLSTHLRDLVNNPRGADFLVICGPEKVPFHCHSLIFNSRWPMILREHHWILADIAKGLEAIIEMPTVDPDTFTLALEYIYTGTLNVSDLTDRKLGVLTDFAKFRKVPGLKELATSFLVSRQPTSRIVSSIAAYVQSSSGSGEMLRLENDTKYESFIAALASRAADLVDLRLFDLHQLHKLRRIDMIHLIRRDDFSVPSELSVFRMITTWAEKVSGNDQDILMENLSFLVAHVRLPLMNMEELQWIESLGWVPQNLMREAYKFKETGISNHASRSRPRKFVVPSSSPSTSHPLESSSPGSSLSSHVPISSHPSSATTSTRTSLTLGASPEDPQFSDQIDNHYDGTISPSSNTKKRDRGGAPLPSPTSNFPTEPSSPPLVRKEKRSKRTDSDVTTPPPLQRNDSAPFLVAAKRPRKNKSKQDASPLLRSPADVI